MYLVHSLYGIVYVYHYLLVGEQLIIYGYVKPFSNCNKDKFARQFQNRNIRAFFG